MSEDGELVVRVAIVENPDAHVTATLNGETLRYDAVREAPPACEA